MLSTLDGRPAPVTGAWERSRHSSAPPLAPFGVRPPSCYIVEPPDRRAIRAGEKAMRTRPPSRSTALAAAVLFALSWIGCTKSRSDKAGIAPAKGHRPVPGAVEILPADTYRGAQSEGRAGRAVRAPAPLAGPRVPGLCPLRHEHLHRPGVGRGDRGPEALQSDRSRRRAVGRGGQGGGHPGPHRHGQAPRRLLPLAEPLHGALGQEFALEGREGRRRRRGRGGLPQGRARSSASTSRPGTGTSRATATRPATTSTSRTSSASS